MAYLYQFAIIMAASWLGELVSRLVPLPIPAAVWGILILFLGLQTKLVKLHWVEKAGGFLLDILPILFVSPVVNLIACWEPVSRVLVPTTVIALVTTAAVFAVAGWVTQLLRRRKRDDK